LVAIGLTPVQSAAVSSSTHGHPRAPEARVAQPGHGPDGQRADDEDQEVPRHGICLERDAGQVRPADRVDPVLAPGEVQPLDRPPVADLDGDVAKVSDGDRDDLAEAERDDGEVVAAHAQGRRADHHAEQRRGRRGEPQADPEAPRIAVERRAEHGRVEEAHGIGADREEGGIAEVEQAREADHDVEPEGEEDVDHPVGHGVDGLQAERPGRRTGTRSAPRLRAFQPRA
jgi:hypothetical protein